jgi:sugar lactone lactonase YvrE
MRKLVLAACAAFVVAAAAAGAGTKPFPDRIALPNGWNPEGIAIAPGGTFYVGSIATGDVYRGSLRTGEGARLVDAPDGRAAIGVDYAAKRLVVAGGPTGKGFVYDARTGAPLAEYQLATGAGATFVNDVVVRKGVAWFTDSNRPVLYKVTLATGAVETVTLSGDYQHQAGFNLNGIDATPSGKALVVVQSGTGFLFEVDPATGATTRIDLGGDTVTMGDGILLRGKTLYVVRNRANEVVVISLASDLESGRVVRRITSPAFRVPTTIDDFGRRVYAVNARFGTPVTPDTDYDVVRVPGR